VVSVPLPLFKFVTAVLRQVFRYYQPISVRDRFKVEEQLGRREFTGPLRRDSLGNVNRGDTAVGLPALQDYASATPRRRPPESLPGTPGSSGQAGTPGSSVHGQETAATAATAAAAAAARREEVNQRAARVADPDQREDDDMGEDDDMDEDYEEEANDMAEEGEEEEEDAALFDAAFKDEGQQAEAPGTASKGDAPVADLGASVAGATTRAVSEAAAAAAAPIAADDATGGTAAPAGSRTAVPAGSETAAPAGGGSAAPAGSDGGGDSDTTLDLEFRVKKERLDHAACGSLLHVGPCLVGLRFSSMVASLCFCRTKPKPSATSGQLPWTS
jgi:hypothetical protein